LKTLAQRRADRKLRDALGVCTEHAALRLEKHSGESRAKGERRADQTRQHRCRLHRCMSHYPHVHRRSSKPSIGSEWPAQALVSSKTALTTYDKAEAKASSFPVMPMSFLGDSRHPSPVRRRIVFGSRQRERMPDRTVVGSSLVYRLTQSCLARSLENLPCYSHILDAYPYGFEQSDVLRMLAARVTTGDDIR